MRQAAVRIVKSKIFIICVAAFLLYTLAGFFIAPAAIRWYVPIYTQKNFHCRSTLGKVRVNPFLLTVEARGFSLDQPHGTPLITVKRIFVDLQSTSLLFFRAIIQKLSLDNPVVHLAIEPNGKLNFAQLAGTKKSKSSPFPLVLRNLTIKGGEITIVDRRQCKPFTTDIRPLNISVKDLSTLKNRNGKYYISASILNGGTFYFVGKVSFYPLRSSGKLNFSGIRAQTLWGFLKNRLNLQPPAGRLGIIASYRLDAAKSPAQITMDNIKAYVSNLSLKPTNAGKPFIELKKAKLIASHFDTNTKDLEIKKFLVDGVHVGISGNNASGATPVRTGISGPDRNAKPCLEAGNKENKAGSSGTAAQPKQVQAGAGRSPTALFSADKIAFDDIDCNLAHHSIVFSRIAFNKGHLDLVRDRQGRIDGLPLMGGEAQKSGAPGSSKAPVSNWKLMVKSLQVQDFTSHISDLAQNDKPLYTLQNIDAKATDIDGKSPFDFKAAFSVEQGGKVNVQGKVDPAAHSAKAAVDVSSLALTPLQPYLQTSVNLVLRSAEISSRGTFQYGSAGKGAKTAYDGSLRVDKLQLSQPHSSQTYLGWNFVEIPKLRLTLQPNVLDIPGMTVSKPLGELIIEPNRKLNLAKIFKSRPGTKESKPGKDHLRFTVSRIKVVNGDMSFADLSLKPNFKTVIHGLKGTIAGLSSDRASSSQVRLQGVVNQYGSVKINGVIRPFEFKRLADIRMVFRNLDMTNFSPYSGKFAGRTIEAGKLSANLVYKIQNGSMIGNNEITVDNLLLGGHVPSRNASDLPLDLVIALLKGPNGRINIALPVEGNLNDPHFSFGPLVWKAFKGLIEKAVTSPFRAIGALLGGKSKAPDLVEFDPGSTELQPPQKEMLKQLAQAMQKRPELKLVIQGMYSPDADVKALKKLSVRRAVATRLGIKLGRYENPGPLDFADPKTQKILEKLYAGRFGKTALDKIEREIEQGRIKPRIPNEDLQEKAEQKKGGLLSKMIVDLKLYKFVPGVKSPKQALACAAEEYARLVDSEKVPNEALLRLAYGRARAVAAELETTDGVRSNRLAVEKANLQSGAANPVVRLGLAALSS